MKKAFIVYFRILKKLPITISVTTLLIVLCFVYMNFYGMIFLLLLIPGLVFADFVIKLPFIAHRDMKHTAKLYGCADTPFRQALKDILNKKTESRLRDQAGFGAFLLLKKFIEKITPICYNALLYWTLFG